MENFNEQELDDIIEALDENDNKISLKVIRYFYYNNDEYIALEKLDDENEKYIMKVDIEQEDGEDVEVYSGIEDTELYETLLDIAFNKIEE